MPTEHPDRRLSTIVVIVVVILLVAVGGWLGYRAYLSNLTKTQQKAYDAMYAKAEASIIAGKYADAESTLTTYLNSKPPKKYLPSTDGLLGSVYKSQKMYDKALVWYKRSEQDLGSLDLGTAMEIAGTANLTGDKATALKYYQAAAPLWQKETRPDAYQQLLIVQNDIKLLQAKP